MRAWVRVGVFAVIGCGGGDDATDAGDAGMMSAPVDSGQDDTEVDPTAQDGPTGDSGEDDGESGSTESGSTSGSSGSGSSDDGVSTTIGVDLQECLDRVDAVTFDNTPPEGETRVPSLGTACIDMLEGADLWMYHCRWCHSTLDNNDINERTAERVLWAVTTSEGLGNWPTGDLSDNAAAQARILEALLASPPAVMPDHPHPLPKYDN